MPEVLEGLRRHRPRSVFVLMSTNKVYGDTPNELPLVEQEARWEYAPPRTGTGSTRAAGSTAESTRSLAPRSWPPT